MYIYNAEAGQVLTLYSAYAPAAMTTNDPTSQRPLFVTGSGGPPPHRISSGSAASSANVLIFVGGAPSSVLDAIAE